MSWELDDEHDAFRASCRRFTDRKIRPVVDEAERLRRPPDGLLKKMGSAGLLGLTAPVEYGGSDADALGRGAAGRGAVPGQRRHRGDRAGQRLHGRVYYGNDEQRRRWVPGIVAGDLVASIAVTELGTGSDVAAITTKAEPVDGGYRINGRKMFITNAGFADVFVVAARTGRPGHRGVTTFVVESGNPGLGLGRPLVKMGWHGSDTREVALTDCLVAEDDVLGELDRGFHQIRVRFQLERVARGYGPGPRRGVPAPGRRLRQDARSLR